LVVNLKCHVGEERWLGAREVIGTIAVEDLVVVLGLKDEGLDNALFGMIKVRWTSLKRAPDTMNGMPLRVLPQRPSSIDPWLDATCAVLRIRANDLETVAVDTSSE
jgi:hypothetical protein